jgi:transcriptional regulator with XRE-family HTH domain
MARHTLGAQLLDRLINPVPDAPTQTEIATAIGVTQQTVSGWLKGTTAPSPERAELLEKLFGIPESAWREAAGEPEQGAA